MFAGAAVYRQHRQRSSLSTYRDDSSFFIETTTYRQRQLKSTTFSSFHRFVIHRRTADLQKRQRSSTVYDDLSDK